MPRPPQRSYFFADHAPDFADIAEARASYSDWLRSWQKSDSAFHREMLVVLSELLANAIDASARDDGEVVARAWLEDESLVLEVTNTITGPFTPVHLWDYDDPLRHGGRGLVIVNALVDDIEIGHRDDAGALVVRCARSLPQRAPRSA